MAKYSIDESRLFYRRNIERATIVALILTILIFLLFPKFDIQKKQDKIALISSIKVEDIPVTHQGARRKPPPKPAVPIPSEDESIPDDVTIEETEINFDFTSERIGEGLFSNQRVVFQPRPILEVIPEYPKELQKKGIQGVVKLHLHVDKFGRVIEAVVLENTTNSNLCAEAARRAALKGRYVPATKAGKATDIWIVRSYSFGLQK